MDVSAPRLSMKGCDLCQKIKNGHGLLPMGLSGFAYDSSDL